MTQFEIVTLADRPDLYQPLLDIQDAAWPQFMRHETISNRYWLQLLAEWPQFQFALFDTEQNQVAAGGHSIPFHWPGDMLQLPDTGWDWALQSGMTHQDQNGARNIQCALSIAVLPQYRGAGLSHRMIEGMKQIGRNQGFNQLIAPVRPNMKKQYPLIPMPSYIQWTNPEGLPFDPWLRAHVRSGARLIKVCPRSMTVSGTVAQWEQWAAMPFPESGLYTIDGALMPLKIAHEKNIGLYIEPNVWVVYDLKDAPN